MRDSRISEGLNALKLAGMAAEYERQEADPASSQLSMSERLAQMIIAEQDLRADRRTQRLLNKSGLNPAIIPEKLVYRDGRGLDRGLMAELLACQYIKHGHNITITGATGSGKTYVGSALGRAAVRQGIPVFYFRAHRLVENLAIARIDGSIRRVRAALRKAPLLILDEFGLFDINEQGKEEILDILEDRVGSGSTIVLGQLSIKEWHEFIGTPLLADAILDRILCRSYNINLHGGTMRERRPEAPVD